MSDPVNPHDKEEEPDLHEAYKEGSKAYRNGHPVPDQHKNGASEEACAWINGYMAAQIKDRME